MNPTRFFLLFTLTAFSLRAEEPTPGIPKREKPDFKILDLDADGKVSEKEFKDGMPAKEGKKGKSNDKAGDLFRLGDKNGDGFWDVEEYTAAILAGKEGKSRKVDKKEEK